jgi:YbbR domain-containing protein
VNSRVLLERTISNWPAKVISIAMAAALFAFHRMNSIQERFFSVPLAIEGASGLVPASSYPRTIRIKLRGDTDSIYPIIESDVEAYIDIARYDKPGTYRVPVLVRKAGTALGVESLELIVDPSELSMSLDTRTSKVVDVRIATRGRVDAGYEVESLEVAPHEIRIEGPNKLVTETTNILTEPVDLDSRTENFTLTERLVRTTPLLLYHGDTSVQVSVKIKPVIVAQSYSDLTVEFRGLDELFYVTGEMTTIELKLQGPRNDIDRFKAAAGTISVDCAGITSAGEWTLPLIVNVPESISIISCDPSSVTLSVKVVE